jgi:hypothetical protein
MADTSTIASLATAGGTLILALATFASTRSANRSARVSEQALKVGLRPVLFNARPQDPSQKVGYIDNHWLVLRDGLAAVQWTRENLYLAIPLRNVATGLAVLHGWYLWTEQAPVDAPPPPVEDFRRLGRDLYVPAGDVSFWQAALRDSEDPLYDGVRLARTPARTTSPGCGCARPRVTGTSIAPTRAEAYRQARSKKASSTTRPAAGSSVQVALAGEAPVLARGQLGGDRAGLSHWASDRDGRSTRVRPPRFRVLDRRWPRCGTAS